MNKEFDIPKGMILIQEAKEADAEGILVLIKSAPDALLDVDLDEIKDWINKGQSIVAKNPTGDIIGHQGMAYWENSNLVELRSAFVNTDYRGQGLGTKMKKVVIEKAKTKYPGATIFGFTEKESMSRGILGKLNFTEISLDEAWEDPFSICPADCFKKTGEDCGCKIFVLDTVNEEKTN